MKELRQDKLFTTARMQVRKLRSEDLLPFHEMQGDEEVMRYVDKKAKTLDENRRDLERVIEAYDQEALDFLVWAIDHRGSGDFLGTFALVKDKEDNWEIGYRFLRKFWGQGFATEAVEGMLAFCEKIAYIDNLIAYADLRNTASQKVLSKAGFVNLGIKYNDEAESEDYIYSANTSL